MDLGKNVQLATVNFRFAGYGWWFPPLTGQTSLYSTLSKALSKSHVDSPLWRVMLCTCKPYSWKTYRHGQQTVIPQWLLTFFAPQPDRMKESTHLLHPHEQGSMGEPSNLCEGITTGNGVYNNDTCMHGQDVAGFL